MGPVEKSSTLPLNAPIAPVPPPPATTSVDLVAADDATTEDHAPSRQSLLMRAAELGPQRLTLDNIMMAPTDPILAQKIQPRVAERRARFRTVVKVALGVCAGLCLIGTAATALSSSGPAPATKSVSTHSVVPAAAIVPKEPLELPTVTKAAKIEKPAAVAPAPRRRARR
ncbi:MAG: hypothetical protein KIT84_36940 [Labilithrix sp.]|nr:hypothetical protein [Labilithrix sp.]MCW5816644.1 hypothetical protein [Labilithrix sp.]